MDGRGRVCPFYESDPEVGRSLEPDLVGGCAWNGREWERWVRKSQCVFRSMDFKDRAIESTDEIHTEGTDGLRMVGSLDQETMGRRDARRGLGKGGREGRWILSIYSSIGFGEEGGESYRRIWGKTTDLSMEDAVGGWDRSRRGGMVSRVFVPRKRQCG